MHPFVIVIPVAALALAPNFWAKRVLKEHDKNNEDFSGNAAKLARDWLDRNNLKQVSVQLTDLGDHYDADAKAVRLSRSKYDSKTLTAVTTAAHEVSHAIQDETGYLPFIWRSELVKFALVAGQLGTVVLIAIPVSSLLGGRAVPPAIIGSTIATILGSGLAAHVAALPTEFDASFNRALPLLQDGVIEGEQVEQARKILVACSLTYVASSLLSVLHFWPWLGRHSALSAEFTSARKYQAPLKKDSREMDNTLCGTPGAGLFEARRRLRPMNKQQDMLRKVAKPLVRAWFRLSAKK